MRLAGRGDAEARWWPQTGRARSRRMRTPAGVKPAPMVSLKRAATAHLRKIRTLGSARILCRRARAEGRRVVFTNGCFDLLHPGHVRYLAAARSLGDLLVVGLNADASVRRLKGRGRPLQHEAARAEVLAGLASVDAVVLFEADTPLELIVALAPAVLVKGADWGADAIVGAAEVGALGGKVVRIELVAGQSTTRLIERAAGQQPEKTTKAKPRREPRRR